MENHVKANVESLVERVEEYSKASIELYKLKAIDKSSVIISSLAAKLTFIILFSLLFLILNIGIALWIGDVLGKTYYGFFIIAAFYSLIGALLYAFRDQLIKTPVKNSIITHALN